MPTGCSHAQTRTDPLEPRSSEEGWMRTRTVALTLCAITATATLGLVPVSTNADAPGCVTRGEYREVERGWSKKRVAARFDTHGRLVLDLGGIKARRYPACGGGGGLAFVYYKQGRVNHKGPAVFV